MSAMVAENFKKAKITAVDGDQRILNQRTIKPFRNQISAVWDNVLYPTSPEKWTSDVVIFCEARRSIVEHVE